MKRQILTTLIAAACTVTAVARPVQAATDKPLDTSDSQNVGAMTGFVAGALIGGPAIVIATAGGAKIGELVAYRKNHALLQTQLAETRNKLAALETDKLALQQQLAQQQLEQRNLLASIEKPAPAAPTCCGLNEVVLHFRTNSSTLEPHYQEALQHFIDYSNARPAQTVEILGYADRRGKSGANLQLSQQRVEAVAAELRALGLTTSTYETVAFGEKQPVIKDESMETDFFDRRVILRLKQPTLLGSAAQ